MRAFLLALPPGGTADLLHSWTYYTVGLPTQFRLLRILDPCKNGFVPSFDGLFDILPRCETADSRGRRPGDLPLILTCFRRKKVRAQEILSNSSDALPVS